MISVRIFVRLGALRRFDLLKRKTAELPVRVAWDRRRSERRGASSTEHQEQRKADRRQAPPFTWEAADFVVVVDPDSTEPGSPQ